MIKSSLYSKLLHSPKNAPVFFSSKLNKEDVLKSYQFGLFPWTNHPVSWWCPDPRMVLLPKEIYKQKSTKRFLNRYEIRLDSSFEKLIHLCASTRTHTWLDDDFIRVYCELFKDGFAHSIEVFDENKLVGGMYGLIIGKVFFGESMFSLAKNASKVAMIRLCELLAPYDFLIDCQVHNPHLAFMGAKELARKDFLAILKRKTRQKSGFDEFKALSATFAF